MLLSMNKLISNFGTSIHVTEVLLLLKAYSLEYLHIVWYTLHLYNTITLKNNKKIIAEL